MYDNADKDTKAMFDKMALPFTDPVDGDKAAASEQLWADVCPTGYTLSDILCGKDGVVSPDLLPCRIVVAQTQWRINKL